MYEKQNYKLNYSKTYTLQHYSLVGTKNSVFVFKSF